MEFDVIKSKFDVSEIIKLFGGLWFLLRYGLVSSFCAISDYFVFLLLYRFFHIDLASSFCISYVTISIMGYFGLVKFAFRLKHITISSFVLFITQLIFVAMFGYTALYLALQMADPEIAKALQIFATFFVSVIYSRVITFKTTENTITEINKI